MDTTETYIKMCNCEEIQGLLSRKQKLSGDYAIYCPTHNNILGWVLGEFECVECPVEWVVGDSHDALIWLPHQDQLQEMITKDYAKDITRPWVHLCGQFYKWAHLNWCDFASMEQLWLGFVMKEKYNKVWDGGKWK